MKIFRKMLLLVFLWSGYSSASAQLYTGMSGLIHVPSAEMHKEGNARIGMYFLNKEFTPDGKGFAYKGEKYNTTDYYLSITPFWWMEASYTFTLQKTLAEGRERPKFNQKDRYFSLKLSPIQEKKGKWWPSVAVGANDFYGTGDKDKLTDEQIARGDDGNSQYFCNYYVAMSKHLDVKRHELGVHLAYRHFKRNYNNIWNGVVGGITYRPSFAQNLRAIAEYTGNEINVGADCLLWKHLFLQVVLQDGKYFSGGVCFCVNLF